MHILLILLKIIGIFLLFFICLVGLVLLAAVRYSFSLKAEEGSAPACQVRVNWLLIVLSVNISYIDRVFDYRLKLFGHQVMGNQQEFQKKKEEKRKRKEQKRKEQKRKEQKQEKQESSAPCPPPPLGEADHFDSENHLKESEKEDSENRSAVWEKTGETDHLKEISEKEESEKEEPEKEKIGKKEPEKKKTEKEKIKKETPKKEMISSKLSQIGSLWEKWEKINQEYAVRELIAFGKDCMFRTIRYILPQKWKGFVRFGFDDPATTGMVTGGIALFYPKYQKSLAVSPDFTAACFEGDFRGRGRIRPGYFLYMIFHILRNPDVRKLLKKAWKSR